MKVTVDFSVVTAAGEAVGNVSGVMECVVEPNIGDIISMMTAPNGAVIPSGHQLGGQLRVTNRILAQSENEPLIGLSDMVANSREEALALMSYFESGYGLYANVY